jgi:hypothetical protein
MFHRLTFICHCSSLHVSAYMAILKCVCVCVCVCEREREREKEKEREREIYSFRMYRLHFYSYFKNLAEVLGGICRLLSFNTTQTAQKTTRPAVILLLLVRIFVAAVTILSSLRIAAKEGCIYKDSWEGSLRYAINIA